ncbi:MAG TPA: POTRA domain-containing protein, partial [Candidatus Deferrimicrobiaceae bacterium]
MKPVFRYPLAAVLLAFLTGWGAIARAEGFKVVGIEVQGARRVKASALTLNMKTKVGRDFDLQEIRDDVKTIWKMGFYDDVRFDSEEVPGGYKLTIVVSEKPIVSRVNIEGNKEVDNADLKGAITIRERDLFQEEKVRESVRKMTDLYHNKGFYDAAIDGSVTEDADGSMKIGFRIREGEKVKIARIQFSGNHYLSDGEIRKVLETKEKGFFSFITDSGTF